MKKINFKKLVSSLGIAMLGGFLGAYGGSDGTSKAWRRYGLTIMYTLYALLRLKSLWALNIISIFFVLSKGYGIPDKTDEGSSLGKFWYNFFKHNHLYADLATRGTLGLMLLSCVTIVPILTKNWANYFIYGLALVFVHMLISWRNLGTFIFLNKDLGWAEFVTWTVTTFSIIKIIG